MKSLVLERNFIPHACGGDAAFLPGWRIGFRIECARDALFVSVSAPRTEAPSPPGPSGRFPHLWRHDAVEVFLLGAGETYWELEFGPHGHYWFLHLEGRRNITGEIEPLAHSCRSTARRWEAAAKLPAPPFEVVSFNVACILGAQRLHGSLSPLPGKTPDFHQLEHFLPFSPTDSGRD